jgi:hypothetical protein
MYVDLVFIKWNRRLPGEAVSRGSERWWSVEGDWLLVGSGAEMTGKNPSREIVNIQK